MYFTFLISIIPVIMFQLSIIHLTIYFHCTPVNQCSGHKCLTRRKNILSKSCVHWRWMTFHHLWNPYPLTFFQFYGQSMYSFLLPNICTANLVLIPNCSIDSTPVVCWDPLWASWALRDTSVFLLMLNMLYMALQLTPTQVTNSLE